MSEAARAAAPVISAHPYFGIAGVFLGAMTATLNARLVSAGLPDLRGAMGLGVDDAAWMPTVLNMGTMFIGVFAVFLAAVYGIRRVLLVSGAVFTLVSVLLPGSAGVGMTLPLLGVAGLASGSFYSLTLTFVARNLPPKLLIFGVAAYALDILATSHAGTLVAGLVVDRLSWHWLFWVAAVLTPLTMLCVWFGVPAGEPTERPSWRGFLYASLGLSLIYGALDQGQRLDWWASGTFTGMLAAGAVLVGAAAVRRWRQPNPFVDLPALRARNIGIFGMGIFTIRLVLLAPLLVIPSYLGNVQQYRPLETGEALAWIAAPQAVLVWVAALVCVFVPARVVMAVGFAAVAVGCWMASRLDAAWSGESFWRAEMVFAAGVGTAFVALVINVMVTALETGAVAGVARMATYSGCMHTIRLLGGEIGAAAAGRLLSVREQWHSHQLGQWVEAGSWQTGERLAGLAAAVMPGSANAAEAQAKAAGVLSLQVRGQALTLAASDVLVAMAWVVAGYLCLLVLLEPAKIDLRQAGKGR